MLATIHRLIEFVVREGPQFEAAIMHREEKNPQYKFLFDYQTPEHLYYRWKLWSILHGESVNKWSLDEFRMYEGGPLWRPPPVNFFTNGMPEDLVEEADYPFAPGYTVGRNDDLIDPDTRDDAIRRGGGDRGGGGGTGLTEAQRGRLSVWINDLEPSRAQVGDVMHWCLEHADAAFDVVDLIAKSLKRPPTSDDKEEASKRHSHKEVGVDDDNDDDDGDALTVKPATSIQAVVARLYLTSDILYNSGAKVPNASYYRRCFESRLFEMFTDVGSFYRELDSKLKAEQLKQKVMLCFRAWEDWAIYPNDFLIQLQNVFLGLTPNVNTKTSGDEDDAVGVPLESETTTKPTGMTAVTSNVESLDGAPLVQYDGDPLDVDGSPLASGGGDADDDDDFEGVPLDTGKTPPLESTKPSAPAPLFVPSKWESIDPSKAAEEAVTSNRWDLFADDDGRSQPKETPGSSSTAQNDPTENDEDVDGKPLDGFGAAGLGLVAYDDDDALSPPSPPPNTAANEPMSDSRRQALREIEVKVVKYQDELEACRKKGESAVSDEAIAKQVERFRERLLERLGESKDSSPSPTHKISKSASGSKSSKSKPSSSSSASNTTRRHHGSSSKRHGGHSPPRSTRSSRKRSSNPPSDSESSVPSTEKRFRDDAPEPREEGEASDDDAGSVPGQLKRAKHREDEGRHRDRSPRRSRRSRSRTPSPSRRRSAGGAGTPSRSSQKRK
uniref:U2 snRNP-associated SURP motif-containing protein n=1 Tax=Mesocestoides corti TaxID=53468 RepID=A0A5K3F9S0_MESCO